jgi:hypothetical protein
MEDDDDDTVPADAAGDLSGAAQPAATSVPHTGKQVEFRALGGKKPRHYVKQKPAEYVTAKVCCAVCVLTVCVIVRAATCWGVYASTRRPHSPNPHCNATPPPPMLHLYRPLYWEESDRSHRSFWRGLVGGPSLLPASHSHCALSGGPLPYQCTVGCPACCRLPSPLCCVKLCVVAVAITGSKLPPLGLSRSKRTGRSCKQNSPPCTGPRWQASCWVLLHARVSSWRPQFPACRLPVNYC